MSYNHCFSPSISWEVVNYTLNWECFNLLQQLEP
uniref:Uncharacterized protein n=1 Tax=Rhizophora mucronata TaxID=61149 RepID=A0A2P2PQ26_RHIMU